MIPIVYAPKEPGQLIVRGYGPISVWSWDDNWIYDEYQLSTTAGGAISAGTEGVFFRDIAAKNYRQTNMSLQSQLPSGWEMIVLRIGLHIEQSYENDGANPTAANSLGWRTIVAGILEYGYVEFILDNNAVMASGPASRFPIWAGVQGHIDVASNAAAAFSSVSNGTPVASAVPPLQIPIFISDARTFRGTIHFYDALAGLLASTTINIQMILQGFVKQPAM